MARASCEAASRSVAHTGPKRKEEEPTTKEIKKKNLISFYELARVSESGIGESSRRARPAGIGEQGGLLGLSDAEIDHQNGDNDNLLSIRNLQERFNLQQGPTKW